MRKFDASHRKLARAEAKLKELESSVNRHIDQNISVIVERDFYATNIVAQIRQAVPDDISFEVVEAVGHIRSALDKMIADLVAANGKSTSGVGFPFVGLDDMGRAQPFPSKHHERIQEKLTAFQWELVLRQRPYPGGNDTLWGINVVANADKHSVGLVGVGPRISTFFRREPEIKVVGPGGGEIRVVDYRSSQAVGKYLLMQFRNMEAKVEIDTPIEIVFSKLAPVAGKNVLAVLNEQIRTTKQILEIFTAIP